MKKSAVKFKITFTLTAIFLAAGCAAGPPIYYELPVEFRFPEKQKEFIGNYSEYLLGKKIFIDPGHGGEDRRSVGVNKLVVEADINLAVALALRDFFREAGVEVIMSRDRDMTVDLKERSYMANRSGADLFISIHHNAPGQAGGHWVNYTSTYYHAKETDYEYEPSERDLARYIQRDLAYAMRNSGGLGSFDGTYSDYNIYPGAGFSVLRVTEIPSVLVECGFFTNPFEEQRLALEEFNKIQAWGIFRGICRYFAAGVPEIRLLNDPEKIIGSSNLSFSITDKSGINPASIKVYFDSTAYNNFSIDETNRLLTVSLDQIASGEHVIRIIAANKNNNYAFPYHQKILIKNSI
jgi:N-acetylmuramoyl-L-alanine amidase